MTGLAALALALVGAVAAVATLSLAAGPARSRADPRDPVAAPTASSSPMPKAAGEAHGPHGADIAPQPLSDADQVVLDGELALVSRAVRSISTVGDALAAGFAPTGTEQDANDVHLVRWDRMDDRFDPAQPEMLVAHARDADAPIIAVVYYGVTGSGPPPEGFAGGNDHWHEHRGLCRREGGFVTEDTGVAARECRRGGGRGDIDGWMLHVWMVEGWANPAGVFVSDNERAPRA